jgi:dTDP-D-glucose 4,6-dehydratase
VSVSRGVTDNWPRHAGAEYQYADVKDRAATDELISEGKPDLVFYVAAQREPGLAEVEVHRTVSTNVVGTHTVLTAAEVCDETQDPAAVRGALNELSWSLLDCTLRAAPPPGAHAPGVDGSASS